MAAIEICGFCGYSKESINHNPDHYDSHHFVQQPIEINYNKPKGIPNLLESLNKIRELHIRKNQDYASNDNPFSNFEFTEYVLDYFHNNRDKAYVWPIATKLARLGTLLSSNNMPNNESIEDSFLDIATYILLWKADFARRNKDEKVGS